jgi:inositol phosphorylceramide mannosyltransferase catalytic subunit
MIQIPKIIHQIYFGGENAIRPDYGKWRETWLANHPGWEYQFWDAARARGLLERHYPWFLSYFDAYPYWIQRCDAVRYFILHQIGGVYVDMDIESLKPIDPLIDGYELMFGRLIGGFTNAIMGSRSDHALWPLLFKALIARRDPPAGATFFQRKLLRGVYIGESTGPRALTACLKDFNIERQHGVQLCPSYIFEPFSPREEDGRIVLRRDVSRSYAIHHMSSHWFTPLERVLSGITARVMDLYYKRLRPS